MKDYTPTTEAVRSRFVLLAARDNPGAEQEAANGFDRWLDDHDVEVAAAALKNYAHLRYLTYLENPEIPWDQQPEGMARRYAKSASEMMHYAKGLTAKEQRASQWASPLAIKCPSCGANPGDRCYGNGPMNRPHGERREAARPSGH